LYGIDIGWGEEELAEGITGGLMVEEREETPVNQPGSVLELAKRVVELVVS